RAQTPIQIPKSSIGRGSTSSAFLVLFPMSIYTEIACHAHKLPEAYKINSISKNQNNIKDFFHYC
ncbi:MAG: hypothetical protein L0G64_14000, partial [Acinetobacter sp.]|uniref:hypothetical protein n=1 Tax=Acinetobacter sp. TaxID=472 RepID=UPI0026475743